MAFQPRFGIQPCLSVGIFYSGLYLLENIISFSKPHYYIMFPRTCKAFYEKNIKKFAKYLDFIWFNTHYSLVNDYKVNKMFIVFNLKFLCYSILFTFDVCSIREDVDIFISLKSCNFFQILLKDWFPYIFPLYWIKRRIVCQKQITKSIQTLQVV